MRDAETSVAVRPLLAAFVGGTASMGLEVLAARVVHPVFGSTVYVWGSILTVFMIALSAGYYVGGRRAADHASTTRLARFLAVAAVCIGLVSVLADTILRAGAGLPLPARFQPLVPILVLFGPPAMVVGFVSPYAAELESTALSTGDAAGRAYAAGTIGSIVGAVGTTFLLLPYASVPVAYATFVGLLVAGAVFLARRQAPGTAVAVAVALLLVSAGFVLPAASGNVVYETDTAYHHLEVVDDDGVRTLYLNGDRHSATYIDDRSGYVFKYSRGLHLPALYRENDTASLDRILVIGGGGGSTPERYAREYGAEVDVVEIDPEVARVAERYFNATHENVTWHVRDGRRYLRETNATYDAILVDAFQKDGVPYHLMTTEFMTLLQDRLAPDGVVAYNIISPYSGDGSGLYRAEVKTMQRSFDHADAYPTASTQPSAVQNVILVAHDGPAVSDSMLRERADERAVGVPLDGYLGVRRQGTAITTSDVPVYTDDGRSAQPFVQQQADREYLAVSLANDSANATAMATSVS
jgi:spermidine synthase